MYEQPEVIAAYERMARVLRRITIDTSGNVLVDGHKWSRLRGSTTLSMRASPNSLPNCGFQGTQAAALRLLAYAPEPER